MTQKKPPKKEYKGVANRVTTRYLHKTTKRRRTRSAKKNFAIREQT